MRREGAAAPVLTIGKWDSAATIRLPKSFCKALSIDVGGSMHVFMEVSIDAPTLAHAND